MTLFDLLALSILLVSALVGLVRGALREVTTVVAGLLAAGFALLTLRWTGPLARRALDPDWFATAVAGLIMFGAAYLLLKVVSHQATRRIHDVGVLGAIDRGVGAAFGVLRGLVVLGLFAIAFQVVTPTERTPRWVSDALTWPLAAKSGEVLRELAPQGWAAAGDLAPTLERAARNGAADGRADGGLDEAPGETLPAQVDEPPEAQPEPAPARGERARERERR